MSAAGAPTATTRRDSEVAQRWAPRWLCRPAGRLGPYRRGQQGVVTPSRQGAAGLSVDTPNPCAHGRTGSRSDSAAGERRVARGERGTRRDAAEQAGPHRAAGVRGVRVIRLDVVVAAARGNEVRVGVAQRRPQGRRDAGHVARLALADNEAQRHGIDISVTVGVVIGPHVLGEGAALEPFLTRAPHIQKFIVASLGKLVPQVDRRAGGRVPCRNSARCPRRSRSTGSKSPSP